MNEGNLMENSIVLNVDALWDAIYSARDAEKYWRLRRRMAESMGGGDDVYSADELQQKFEDAKQVTKTLEALAPANSF